MDGLLEAADSKENERMSNLKRNGRILALLVIMGILFGTPGMTALAGTMGVGADPKPRGNPDSPLPDPKFRIQRIIQQPHLTSLFR